MKKSIQEEKSNTINDMQENVVPVKRKRGRPPSKNKNLNTISQNKSAQRTTEAQLSKINHISNRIIFQYPPQVPFTDFNLDENLKESSTSTKFFKNIINGILKLWWNGSSPILFDDSRFIKYKILYNIFRFLKHLFDELPPFLLITDSDRASQWLSTFNGFNSFLFSEDENDFDSDLYYTQKSKAKPDILILTSDQKIVNVPLKTYSILIIDQPISFDILADFDGFDIKSRFLICTTTTENIPSLYDTENSVTVTLDDLKNNRYISEILHFCPMTLFQIRQTQQLFKTNKSRLHQIPERLTMFLSHMVQQVKSISVYPSLSASYNGSDDQSGKFQELLKIVNDLQIEKNKIAIIGCDPKLLTFTTSYFIKNKINAYNVNQLLKEKKKIQLIDKFNESDFSFLLLIDPDDFTKYYDRLIIDKIIILEVDVSLTSMMDEILKWQQNKHNNYPQIIRLITDNSIELPLFEMQFEDEEDQDEKEESKSHFLEIDKMKPDKLLLLLKQSASLCFETEGDEVKKQIDFCYSQPQKLFDIQKDFSSNFWNDVTSIDFSDQKSQHQKLLKNARNSDDNSSIATRLKKEMLRRTRHSEQDKAMKLEKKQKELKSKMMKKNAKKKEKQNKSIRMKDDDDFYDVDEESQNDLSDNDDGEKTRYLTKKKISSQKLRSSPRKKNAKKYKEYASGNEDEATEDEIENDDYGNENENDEIEKDNEDENNDDEEEEEEEAQEELENEFEESVNEENDESDENASIAAREKKRLKKKEELKAKLKEQTKSLKKTKSSKKSKRSKRSESKKILERDAQQKVRQRQAQLLQKPRKHIPKFEAMVSFWNLRHFSHYLEILREYGFDRWDKFSIFERPIQELRKIGALIIRNLETTSRENRLLREYFANELRSSELSRLDAALPFARRKLAKSVIRNEFLADLTGMLVLAKQDPKSSRDVILPKLASEIEPLDNEWTEDDDKTLLYLIHEHGLFHIPATFKHNLSKNFLKRFRSFFSIDPSNQSNYVALNSNANANNIAPKVKSSLSSAETKLSTKKKMIKVKSKTSSKSLYTNTSNSNNSSSIQPSTKTKPNRSIGLKQHTAIIHNLCSFGFPNLYMFKAQLNTSVVNLSDTDLQEYVDNIFNYCTCTVKEERKILAQKLVGKIEKYPATKIINRKEMFEKLRTDAVSYDTISAEDIELLSAMSFHGFANTDTSPILLSSCGGECSDQRLLQRVKAIAMQPQIHCDEKVPNFYNTEESNQSNTIEDERNDHQSEPQETKEAENETDQHQNIQANSIISNEVSNLEKEELVQSSNETNTEATNYQTQEPDQINQAQELEQDHLQTQEPEPEPEQFNNQEQIQNNEQVQEQSQSNQNDPEKATDVVVTSENDHISDSDELFPLKLNDRQVLKSIGTIDPRFHDEKYIYPVGYECCVCCTNPFADSNNLIWLNLSVRLLNTKIDKKDKTNKNGDFLLFVVRKERERSTEISDDSPDKVFEKVRQKIIRKTKAWMPPFDGDEMFGFNSAKVHRLLLQMPNINECVSYKHRFFRLPMPIDHEWPILGRYEDKRKQMQIYTMFNSLAAENNSNLKNQNNTNADDQNDSSGHKQSQGVKKLKHLGLKASQKNKIGLRIGEKTQSALMKKREFGLLMKPLVINCKPVFDLDEQEASVSVCGNVINFEDLMKRYEQWDGDIIRKYIPQATVESND